MTYIDDSKHIVSMYNKYVNISKIRENEIRAEIQQSWDRCKEYGIKVSDNGSNLILDDKKIEKLKAKKRDLIGIAKPIMENLFQFVSGTGFLIVLSDERGFVLEVLGETNTLEKANNINIVIGSNWAEEHGGTNGIGTALALQKPVQITGIEHYIKGLQSWTCSAAPIYDDNGRNTGIMQISGPSYATHLHTLGMIVAAVKAVEEQMRTEKRNQELALVNSHLENIFYHMSDGVLIFNQELICTNVNSVAEKILNIEAANLVNKKCESIFVSKNTAKLNSLIRSGNSFSDVEIFFESDKSSTKSYLVSGDITHDRKGKISDVVLFIYSINKINKIVNRFSGAQATFCFEDIIGQSPQLKDAIRSAKAAAETDSTVVLEGETGTGKEIFAQSIHNRSSRRNGPFVALNCGAIPRELIDSELFGYVDGAFTGARKGGRPGKFELANGGTLFLDEIIDLNFSKQVSLLRAIQERKIVRVGGNNEIPVDVRIIVATNKNLKEQVERGLFRQDLFYRLNVLKINLPPLRNRVGDIPLLFKHFFTKECKKLGKQIKEADKEFIEKLQKYDWPGNVREIQNVAERVACNLDTEYLTSINLPQDIIIPQFIPDIEAVSPDSGLNKHIVLNTLRTIEKEKKEDMEKRYIVGYLEEYGGNISKVAERMGVSRTTIYRKIKLYGIEN